MVPQIVNRLTRRKVPSLADLRQRPTLPAWMLSLFLHAGILVGLAVLWTSKPHGTSRETGGPIGIAVVHERQGVEEYMLVEEISESQATTSESSFSNSLSSLPSASDSKQSQDELLKGLMPQLDAGGAQAAGDVGLGGGSSSLPTGNRSSGVKAKLFGIEGQGSRFVYVIDRSDSMNGYEGKPMQRARGELLESMTSLGPTHQFQVIFYNDTPLPYGGTSGRGPELLRGDERTKELVQRFIQTTPAIGGTNHVDAIRMALAMGPDILFFLTDGDYPQPAARAIEDILNRAARLGTTIHCIQFGEGSRIGRGNWISYISESTGGQFRYVDVSQF